MEYAPGLKVNWTDKEWRKIQEIQARRDIRGKDNETFVPWEGRGNLTLRNIILEEKKRYKKKAIYFLGEAGLSIIEIAEMFELEQRDIERIIRSGREGKI